MSSYLDKHKAKINATGTTIGESTFNSTANFINSTFKDSPFYKSVKVNGIDVDVIVSDVTTKTRGTSVTPVRFTSKYLFFRPNTKVNMGDIVEFDSRKWLIGDVQLNNLYPTARIHQCNETLLLSGTVTEVEVGQTVFGDPIYDTTTGTPISVPCIVTTSTLSIDSVNEAINPIDGRLSVTIPYTTHIDLVIDGKFSMYGEQYHIIEIDKTKQINGVGLLVIQGKKVGVVK